MDAFGEAVPEDFQPAIRQSAHGSVAVLTNGKFATPFPEAPAMNHGSPISTVVNRYVTVAGFDDIDVRTAPVEPPGPSEVLVRTRLVGICGSDLHAIQGRHPSMPLPYQPGHEVVGTVAATGPGVTRFAPGDRVFVEPNLVCGSCRNCQQGRYNICANLRVFGCQTPGGMADYFIIGADRLHAVPDALSDEAAALVEPLATPVHAVRLAVEANLASGAADLTGKDVVVLGAGAIGLFSLVAARAAGARRVIVTDLVPEKCARARRLGADAVFRADDGALATVVRDDFGGGADIVFDCVATSASMAQAVSMVRKGGTVLVVGVPSGSVSVPLDLVQDWEITVRGVLMYVRDDIENAVRILASGQVPINEFVSEVLPLARAGEAFARAAAPDSVKVLVSASR